MSGPGQANGERPAGEHWRENGQGPAGDELALQAVLAEHIATWPGPAAAGAIRAGAVPTGAGGARAGAVLTGAEANGAGGGTGAVPSGTGAARATAGPVEQAFAWASVTKLLVSLAVWVAVEEGTVSFDDPAGPPGSTLAHLLAHASGLPFEGHQPISAPGRRRTYSNTGIEVAAAHLAAATDMSFNDYLAGAVTGPLAMSGTSISGSPAHSAAGPLVDLMALAGELMSPTLVSPGTLQKVTAVAWPGLAGVLPGFGRHDPCDWGLGPEVRSHKSPHWTATSGSPFTFGHFGQSGSLLWVDPMAGVALAAIGSTNFGPWAKVAWPALADAVLGTVDEPGGERTLSWWST